MTKVVEIYRLEHRSSGLGPFEHKSSRQKHPPQDALKFIKSEAKNFMPDLRNAASWMKRYPKAVFGWNSKEKFDEMILDAEGLRRLGFRCKVYVAFPIFVSSCGQVIFLR